MATVINPPLFVKISLIVELVGYILNIIAFTTPYWRSLHFEEYRMFDDGGRRLDSAIVIQGFDEGLWRRCVNSICADLDIAGRDWLQAVRVFSVIGIVASTVAIVTITFYVLKTNYKQRATVFLVAAISSVLTAAGLVISVLIYGISVKLALSWSFCLSCVSAILFGVAGLLLQISFVYEMKHI